MTKYLDDTSLEQLVDNVKDLIDLKDSANVKTTYYNANTITDVSYDSTNNKLTKTKNGSSSDIISFGSSILKNTGTTNGTIPLIGAGDKLPSSIIPASAITDTFVVSSQAAMLALSSAEIGDVCVRTDLNKSFILKAEPYSTLANWQELLTPLSPITSVNGQTGVVVLTASNVGAVDYTSASQGLTSTQQSNARTNIGAQAILSTAQQNAVDSGITSALVTQIGTNQTDIGNKMDKTNPTGTGKLSINRKANSSEGSYSSTLGWYNEASGDYSHSIGYSTAASGFISSASGFCTIANRRSQVVFGEYNVLDTGGSSTNTKGDYVEIVGNGTADNIRSNARTLDWSGNEVLAGTSTATGFKTASGTSSQFLKADGSVDSTSYQSSLSTAQQNAVDSGVTSQFVNINSIWKVKQASSQTYSYINFMDINFGSNNDVLVLLSVHRGGNQATKYYGEIEIRCRGGGSSFVVTYCNVEWTNISGFASNDVVVVKDASDSKLLHFYINTVASQDYFFKVLNMSSRNSSAVIQIENASATTVNITSPDYTSVSVASVPSTSTANQLYGTDSSGNQTTFAQSSNVTGNVFVKRKSSGQIKVRTTPSEDDEAVGKGYVDGLTTPSSWANATNSSNVLGGICKYTVIGKLVLVHIEDVTIASGTASQGALLFSGLPNASVGLITIMTGHVTSTQSVRFYISDTGNITTHYTDTGSFGDAYAYHYADFCYIKS